MDSVDRKGGVLFFITFLTSITASRTTKGQGVKGSKKVKRAKRVKWGKMVMPDPLTGLTEPLKCL